MRSNWTGGIIMLKGRTLFTAGFVLLLAIQTSAADDAAVNTDVPYTVAAVARAPAPQ